MLIIIIFVHRTVSQPTKVVNRGVNRVCIDLIIPTIN